MMAIRTIDSVKLQAIINAYKIFKEKNPDKWIDDCSNSNNLETAIKLAALARNNLSQKHPHQYRIPNSILELFYNNILRRTRDIADMVDFDNLYLIIAECSIKDISELTIYDTAQRIGHFLNVFPSKIYLHCGTRIGAEYLLGRIHNYYIIKEQLPEPIKRSDLKEEEIEDLLCIFKNQIYKCIC